MKPTVIIVGGGLSGLSAAYLLHRAGIPFRLLEARERLGGRILSVDASGQPSSDGFDLGPSWYWPGMPTALRAWVDELGLASFPQYSTGDMLFQQRADLAPQRFRSLPQEPESMRLVGGVGSLINALVARLPQECIQLGTRVTQVALGSSQLELECVDAAGHAARMQAPYLVSTLPPRLLASTLAFFPALDPATLSNWREMPTWMAAHAKFFALYERPFWREVGLSGSARSLPGPLMEVHDATSASGQAALFGFLGLSARQRTRLGEKALTHAALEQLVQLFGAEAARPLACLFKDWSADPLTATEADWDGGEHPVPGTLAPVPPPWQGRFYLAGTEAAEQETGYLGGAVEAAGAAVRQIMNRLGAPPHTAVSRQSGSGA